MDCFFCHIDLERIIAEFFLTFCHGLVFPLNPMSQGERQYSFQVLQPNGFVPHQPGKGTAEAKIEAMRSAGMVVADSPARLGETMLEAMGA